MKPPRLVEVAGLLLIGALASGCSGMSATQMGQTAGGVTGATLIPGLGAPLGSLIGTLAGLVIDSQMDKVREQKERASLQGQLASQRLQTAGAADGQPRGEPTRVWVDERVERGRLIAGHFEVRAIP